jgi:hypothetical protein
VTNEVELIRARLQAIGAPHVNTIGYQFDRDVPKDLKFYSAHFKLDLIRAFGSGAFGDQVGLVDIDTVLIRPFPEWVYRAEGLLAYDIGAQVFPEYGRDRILRDLQFVAGRSLNSPIWYGGEFLLGKASAFRRLAQYIELCWPTYRDNVKELHHLGDEMIISAALAMARENGELIQNAGSTGLVSRWWSARTGFVQKSWRAASDVCVVHLPADKVFLAAQSNLRFAPESFLKSYEIHAGRKIFIRKLYNLGGWFFRGKRRYVGSIT